VGEGWEGGNIIFEDQEPGYGHSVLLCLGLKKNLEMKETVIAIYDIGKTNKKIVLFNEDFKIVSEIEEKFAETLDDDGFECDDIEHIESWIKESLTRLVHSDK
jgi:hypothetical protein